MYFKRRSLNLSTRRNGVVGRLIRGIEVIVG